MVVAGLGACEFVCTVVVSFGVATAWSVVSERLPERGSGEDGGNGGGRGEWVSEPRSEGDVVMLLGGLGAGVVLGAQRGQ